MDNPPRFIPKRIKPTVEQCAIQTAHKRVILVDANAGAAKTTTLALRLAESLQRGLLPEKALLLMFTKAAKLAIKQRLAEIGIAASIIRRLKIETFEEFAQQVLLKLETGIAHSVQSNEMLRPYALAALDQVAEKYAHLYPLEISTNNTAITEFLKLQLRTKARLGCHRPGFDESDIEDKLDMLGMSMTHYLWMNEYESLRGAGTENIHFRGAFDATYDLVCLLEHEPSLRTALPEHQVVIADELHDLNEATFRLINMLVKTNKAFFCGAGDKDQVIYTWSGADHQFLKTRFDTEFPSLQRFPLTSSFRFGHQLAEAMGVFKNKASQSGILTRTDIDLQYYGTSVKDSCTRQIVAAIKKWQMAGQAIDGIAILLRDRHQSIHVENALFQEQIPYNFVEMQSYLVSQEVLMLRGMLAMAQKNLHAIKSQTLRSAILEALIVFAEIPFTQEELEAAKKDVSQFPDLLEGFLTNQLQKSANRDKAEATTAAVDYLRAVNPEILAGDALAHIFQIMKLDMAARRIYVDREYAAVVTKAITGFIDVCKESAVTLAAFSHWLDGMENPVGQHSKDTKKTRSKEDAVTIACIDQIKGLEFAHVIIPYLANADFPSQKADPLEEKNRFYVAATRAKQRLTLLAPADANARSRFIGEMAIEQSIARGDTLLRKAQLQGSIAERPRPS